MGAHHRMPFLSPAYKNHLLDLMLSLNTKTPKQGKGFPTLVPQILALPDDKKSEDVSIHLNTIP